MEILNITETFDTPNVFLDPYEPKIEFSGKSFPPDAVKFYEPIFKWIDRYSRSPSAQTIVNLKLDYFNTASSKILLDVLYRFEAIKKEGNNVIIRWYYPQDDEDMEDTGKEFERMVKVPFEHIGYSIQMR